MQASSPLLLDGASLSWPWSLPFIGLILTIATGPLFFPRSWSRHYGKIAAGWSALTIAVIAFAFGATTALDAFLRAMLLDYMSFIALLFSLYVVAGGIVVTGSPPRYTCRQHRHASPWYRAGELCRHHWRRHDRGAPPDSGEPASQTQCACAGI